MTDDCTPEEQAEFEAWFLDLAARSARVQSAPGRLRYLAATMPSSDELRVLMGAR